MERRRFTREFKLEAVRLIRDRGVSYAQATEDLKVHPTQLRNWVKAFAEHPPQAFPGNGQMKPEQLEIARLKREVVKLKAERDILKKAAVEFNGWQQHDEKSCFLRRICNGANGPPWVVAAAEVRTVGTRESRSIAERYWA